MAMGGARALRGAVPELRGDRQRRRQIRRAGVARRELGERGGDPRRARRARRACVAGAVIGGAARIAVAVIVLALVASRVELDAVRATLVATPPRDVVI